MKYYKTCNVLPDELVKMIQKYIDGGYIYIPRKDETRKPWGENSGAKSYLIKRNKDIVNKYAEGKTITQLSKEYYLSQQSIRRIINQEKIAD
jgi:Mor family transcriptional regulator